MILDNDLDSCPEVVARYLKKAGVMGSTRKSFAHITHSGEFRLKPKQKWLPIKGEYFFKPRDLSFDWQASIKMYSLVFISVKDEYKKGVGRSFVKLNSLFTLADQTGPEINESSLGRLLVEFIMIPTALLPSEYLHWEAVDPNHARVVLCHNNLKVAAIFEFDGDGLPIKTSIDRYGNFNGKMSKKSFICELLDYRLHEGLLIPNDIRGAWDVIPEPFYWFHFKIESVHYE